MRFENSYGDGYILKILKRISDYINRFTIRKKIIFYSYLVITPILLVISLIVFFNNYRDTLAEQIDNQAMQVTSVADSIEVLQNDVTDFSTSIYVNYEITRILTSSRPEVVNEDSQLWQNQAPTVFLRDIMALKGYIKTLAIFPENGVRIFTRCGDGSAYEDNIDVVRKMEIYQEALEGKGKVFWKRIPRNDLGIFQTNRSDKLVLYREIYDLSMAKPLGFLIIGVEVDRYVNICENAVHEREGIVILNPEGEELIRYGETEEEVVSWLKSPELVATDYRQRDVHREYGSYHVYTRQNSRNSFIICKIVPKDSFSRYWRAIAFPPLMLLLGFLGGLLPVLMFVSHVISNPLRKICIAMDQFKNGDFSQQVEVTTQGEVGEVAEGFNRMVRDIKTLIDNNYVMALREKESELIALQAQINPHFLYNTLDSLYWQAQNTGNDEIAEDILALSNLFRLVLGQGKGIITVADEKALITQYLQIQKMRFTRLLDYRIEIDGQLEHEEIPKLILQPFVENAVVHGFENAGKACYLTVTGYPSGDMMEFVIEDSGIGMTREQIEAIWQNESDREKSGQKIGRYAIKNVRERLQLRFNEDFVLTVDSKPGAGTTVTIRIPRGEKN